VESSQGGRRLRSLDGSDIGPQKCDGSLPFFTAARSPCPHAPAVLRLDLAEVEHRRLEAKQDFWWFSSACLRHRHSESEISGMRFVNDRAAFAVEEARCPGELKRVDPGEAAFISGHVRSFLAVVQ
jgi:hypothetical protein